MLSICIGILIIGIVVYIIAYTRWNQARIEKLEKWRKGGGL